MASYRDMIYQFFKGKGLSDAAVAGILGNFMTESGLSPHSHNDREGAIGFANWEGGRRTALQQFAAAHGSNEEDPQIQLEFAWHELNTSYTGVLQSLKSAQTPADAAAAFDANYEVSSGAARQQRINYAQQFYTGKGPNPSVSSAGATALSTGGGGGSKPMTAQDYQSVDNLGSLLNSVPDLRKLVDKAVAQDWAPDKFQNAVEDSAWWKTHSQTARSAIIQKANDPASWEQTLSNTKNSISTLSKQLGMSLNAAQLSAIANSALLSGNDSNQQWLTQQIGAKENYSNVTDLGSLQGGMANTAQQLQSLAADYGFTWSPAEVARRAQGILTGQTTIDTYKERLQSWAASAFPSLRKEILSGTTVKDLADPYVQSMSQLLEVDPGTLNVYTPAIRRALQGTIPQGGKKGAEPTSIPLWQFEQQVRSDPRWASTNNAKSTMSSALLQIGSIFGFGPESSG